jgi:hypothetical protein
MWRGCVLLLAVLLSGCASVQQQSVVTTPMRQSLVAGIGDTVLRVEGKESLPNIIGRADIFGRTRPTSFTTIEYGGLQGNKAVLLRSAVVIQSNATTMNATGSTTSRTVRIRRTDLTSVSSEQPTIPIVVDWRVDPRVPMLGQTIVIEAANSISLTYHIE